VACSRVRLVVFDVDGVLVPIHSSWGYLHEHYGSVEEARRNMELYKKGLINYYEWMRLDVEAWIRAAGRPITRRELEEVLGRVPVIPEARRAVEELHSMGVMTALLSGGIDVLVERVARELGVERWEANRLVFDERGLLVPGGIPIVEALGKDRVLRRMVSDLDVELEETMFVGDSQWDAPAFRVAGCSVLVGDAETGVDTDYRVDNVGEVPRIVRELNAHRAGPAARLINPGPASLRDDP